MFIDKQFIDKQSGLICVGDQAVLVGIRGRREQNDCADQAVLVA